MKTKQIIKLLAINAYNFYYMTLKSEKQFRQHFKNVLDPVVGDLVLEISSFGRIKDYYAGVGRLIKIDQKTNPKFPIYHVKTLTEKIIRWQNCRFIKINEEEI